MARESAANIHSICNGVDLAYFDPGRSYPSPFSQNETPIVMTGRMDYWPNSQGAAWFAKEVMGEIVAQIPQARFYAVGANPPRELSALAGDHIVVTGQVEDVRPFLAHAHVVVAPLQIARGVQNKVLEAMAMARPVVATGAATRALAVKSGVELRIEDDHRLFGKAVTDILTNAASCTFGAKGRAYIEKNHEWGQLMTAFEALLDRPGTYATREAVGNCGQMAHVNSAALV
jgi:glycosyltransferase involved in cell wall biosynthesis